MNCDHNVERRVWRRLGRLEQGQSLSGWRGRNSSASGRAGRSQVWKSALRTSRITGYAHRLQGIALLDCLIYIVLLGLLLGISFSAFYETLRHSNELDRLSVTTVRALQAGEQWREDIRAAQGNPRLLEVDGRTELQLTTQTGEIAYAFREGSIVRRSGRGPEAPWLEVVDAIKVSRFSADPRQHVTAWRWEIELNRRREGQGVRRVLTFLAVPGLGAKR